ncbi:MAG: ComEC/Rec2 family competence protein [Lachnospiraceae bacterium]|nr:ComEC/Rec2 family competence protein [Lachnospiraceae bacterium]
MKRPAVLCAAAFMSGIVLAKYSAGVAITAAVGVTVACVWFLKHLGTGQRRVSVADKLLLFAPVFLLIGCGVMHLEQAKYKQNANAFTSCMKDGREVLTEGTISHIRRTKDGIRLELKDAEVAPYWGEKTVYRPVGRLLVYTEDMFGENGELKYGQKILVYGSGSVFEDAPNPGGFDAKTYYFSMGITGAVYGKSVRIQSFSYHRLSQALFQAKNKLLNHYVTYLGAEGAGVISSMLLGERALLSDETQELYQRGGISHILAISGLHVSFIGTALYELLRKTILGRNGAIPVACGGVLLYGSFVEAGTSTKRAVIMFLLLLLATVLGRTYDTLSAMSVSVIVILWGSPGALYTASFQLSFAAAYGASVLAVLLRGKETGETEARIVAERENSGWVRGREYIREKVKSMVVFGLALQAVTFPITVYHFFEYPTYGFFLNPLVVPLMTILLLCGFLSGALGLFFPWLGYFFAGGAKGILFVYELLCRWAETLPGSLLLFGRPELWQIGLYYAVLAACVFVWMGRGGKRVIRGYSGKTYLGVILRGCRSGLEKARVLFCVLLLLPVFLLPTPCARFEAAFLDVGQGDGIVLRERGGAVLMMDGGSSSIQKVGEKRILPYLKSQGIRVIDCAFISHTDSDHISGVKEILEAMPVYTEYRESVPGYAGTPVIKRLVLPERYGFWETEGDQIAEITENGVSGMSAEFEVDEAYRSLVTLAKEKRVEVLYLKAGDRMKVGRNLVFSCLAPEKEIVYENKNAASMVLLASYGEFDMLLTGDMEKEGELRFLEKGVLERRSPWGGDELPEEEASVGGTMPDGGGASDDRERLDDGVFVEILKVSHHGSRTASSEEFISALQPQISVISCGKDNRYGHPHEETLAVLHSVNSRVYRTDESGCVTVKVGKGGIFEVED